MTTVPETKMYEKQISSFISVFSVEPTVPRIVYWSSPSTIENSSRKCAERLPHWPKTKKDKNTDNQIDLDNQTQKHKQGCVVAQICDSSESSPTATIFTPKSSRSDNSLGSSPDSPSIPQVLPSSFSTTNDDQSLKNMVSNSTQASPYDKTSMKSPNLKKKNPKSLALNVAPNVEANHTPEPPSPSFIRPPAMKGKRRPNLLSLDTGAANNNTLVEYTATPRIPTMLQRRGLKHSASTPQMASTPLFCPSGGMTLLPHLGSSRIGNKVTTLENTVNCNAFQEVASGASSGVQMATRLPGVTVGGDSFDRAHSTEDEKPPSYPDGPILMHEPGVYLYSEPKIDEILAFDVVINVAREVKCPFETEETRQQELQYLRNPQSSLRRAITTSNSSFQEFSNVTPKFLTARKSSSNQLSCRDQIPEYIHVPWDHNTDVKDELWDLCKIIKARVELGKKVLVHCQQGASRSATLIIAYGMYINQEIGSNESYQLAQSKSPWVNPNMSLLFSLNDFKKVIELKKSQNARFFDKNSASTEVQKTNVINGISDISPFSSPTLVAIDSTISKFDAFDIGLSTLSEK